MSIPSFQPPSADFGAVRTFQDLRDRALEFIQRYVQYTNDYFQVDLLPPLNSDVFGFGASIASAATINFTSQIHLVTGVAAISTINVPTGFTGGGLTLASRDGFSVTTGGNIALAQNVPANHAIMLSFLPTVGANGLWFGVTS